MAAPPGPGTRGRRHRDRDAGGGPNVDRGRLRDLRALRGEYYYPGTMVPFRIGTGTVGIFIERQ